MEVATHIFPFMQQELLNMAPQIAEDIKLQNALLPLNQERPLKFDDVHDGSKRSSLNVVAKIRLEPKSIDSKTTDTIWTSEFERDKHDQPNSMTAETTETNPSNDVEAAPQEECLPTFVGSKSSAVKTEASLEDNGRERLKRHRVEVAGRVWIPDIWGQEELLKDWIDCTAFDASLMSNNIMSARAALVEEGRRANSSRLRIENSC